RRRAPLPGDGPGGGAQSGRGDGGPWRDPAGGGSARLGHRPLRRAGLSPRAAASCDLPRPQAGKHHALPHGALYLTDFGIARGLGRAGAGGTLRPHTVIGTPGYAPLEQYQGQADTRSDIYALGATLHRLMTGYNPEEGTPLAFPEARHLRPDITAATNALLQRAVALQPADRFPNVQAFAPPLAQAPGQSPARPRARD